MKATLINETGAFDEILACLSGNDWAALEKKAFVSDVDAFGVMLSWLSDNDLAAMEAIYVPRLAAVREEADRSREPERYNKLVQDLSSICDALMVIQARRNIDAGSYEWWGADWSD